MGAKIIRTFTIYQILYTLGGTMTFATYTLFLRAHGLSFFDSGIVNIFFMIGIMVFEIPTGMIGDYFGRKNAMIASCILNSIGFALYGFSDTFLWFIMAELTIAAGRTFSSGSDIAWLKDSLDEINHDHNLEHLLAIVKTKTSAMVIFGGVIGNYIYQSNISLPYFASAILYLLAMGFVFIAFKEKTNLPAEHLKKTMSGFWQTWVDAGRLMKENHILQLLALLQFSWMFCIAAANMTWAPLINETLGRPDLVKWFWVIIALAVGGGNYISSKIARNGQSLKNLIRAQLVTAIPLLAIFFLSPFTFASILLINEFGRGLSQAAMDSLPNRYIPSQIRATTLSVISMIEHFGAILGLLTFGVISDHFGVQSSWFVSGVILLIALAIYIPLQKKIAE